MKKGFGRISACIFCAQIFIACGGDKQTGGSAASSAAPAPGPASAAAQSPAAQNAAPGAKEYPAPSEYLPKPFKPGQWSKIRSVTAGEAPTETTFRVISQEGSAVWLEMETKLPAGTTISQALIELDPKMSLRPDMIKKLRVKLPTGQIQDIPDAILQTAAKPLIGQLSIQPFSEPEKAPRGDASAPAGNFKGCYIQEEERELLGMKIRMKTWSHPAVPIAGFVRSEGVSAGKNITIELLEFGETGAKSSL